MKSLDQLRAEFQRAFGSPFDVLKSTQAEAHYYTFLIRVVPHNSKDETENMAWQLFASVSKWIESEADNLSQPSKIEIMAGVIKPEGVGKQRIFRAGGTISELIKMADAPIPLAVGGNSYVHKYESWIEGTSLKHA